MVDMAHNPTTGAWWLVLSLAFPAMCEALTVELDASSGAMLERTPRRL